MKTKATHGARIVLGLIFFVFGLNGADEGQVDLPSPQRDAFWTDLKTPQNSEVHS